MRCLSWRRRHPEPMSICAITSSRMSSRARICSMLSLSCFIRFLCSHMERLRSQRCTISLAVQLSPVAWRCFAFRYWCCIRVILFPTRPRRKLYPPMRDCSIIAALISWSKVGCVNAVPCRYQFRNISMILPRRIGSVWDVRSQSSSLANPMYHCSLASGCAQVRTCSVVSFSSWQRGHRL